ncbi:hypothetical protein AcV5_009130 [Taiwanofungus camphoratus]|nr:hypothetical protein AcV5_009130 [Antrodia cinnamomea]
MSLFPRTTKSTKGGALRAVSGRCGSQISKWRDGRAPSPRGLCAAGAWSMCASASGITREQSHRIAAQLCLLHGASRHGTGGDYRFACKRDSLEGAVMVLSGETHQAELLPDAGIASYIMRNHASWFKFFAEGQDVDVRETDLMVVRGWTKAQEWNMAAFAECQAAWLASGGAPGSLAKAAFSLDIPPGACPASGRIARCRIPSSVRIPTNVYSCNTTSSKAGPRRAACRIESSTCLSEP